MHKLEGFETGYKYDKQGVLKSSFETGYKYDKQGVLKSSFETGYKYDKQGVLKSSFLGCLYEFFLIHFNSCK